MEEFRPGLSRKEAEPFTQPLVKVREHLSLVTTTTWTVQIWEIQQATKQSYVYLLPKLLHLKHTLTILNCILDF